MSRSRTYAWTWTVVWALGLGAEIVLVLVLTHGNLVFSLDDPYIHLSVAEQIGAHGYGVNAGEFASPCSSIVYPLLLAATEGLGLGPWGPLLINALASGLSVWLLLEFYWRHAVPEGTPRWAPFPNLMAPLLILAINAIALPMTGLEHSLHVLVVIVALRGVVTVAERGPLFGVDAKNANGAGRLRAEAAAVPLSLGVAVAAMPLLRFEGLAMSAAVLGVLCLLGYWRSACAIGAAVALCLVAYGAATHAMGLPFLPSSVLVKSDVAAGVAGGSKALGALKGLMRGVQDSLVVQRWGLVFAMAICALIASAPRGTLSRRSPGVLVGLTMVAALAAHLVAGRYGWFHRYEVYAVAILVTGGVYLLRDVLRGLNGEHQTWRRVGILVGLTLLVVPYIGAAVRSPFGSRNVYEQQFQMGRFATEFFPRRVAVNDLGLVSYRNPNYVLDLWGLGSEKVRRLRQQGDLSAVAMDALVQNADVDFAMIYPDWFDGAVPKSWCLLSTLETEKVTSGEARVYFYATRRSAETPMSAALDRFAPTLPTHVTLTRFSCDAPPPLALAREARREP
jgi:hypothetical protein